VAEEEIGKQGSVWFLAKRVVTGADSVSAPVFVSIVFLKRERSRWCVPGRTLS
jgi:hypothetical protein